MSGSRWTRFWNGCNRISAFIVFVWESALWLSAFIMLPLLIVGFIALLIAALFFWSPSWYYSVSARSEAVSLSLPAERETSWRIEGAIVCSTEPLPALAPAEGDDVPCGSRRWLAYRLSAGEEQVLVLGRGGAPGTAIEVGMEAGPARGLRVSIRGGDLAGVGTLRLVDQGEDVALGSRLNLIWPDEAGPRNLVFPFTADRVRVGRDVTWSDSSLLLEGRMEIFTASDENLSKRTRIEEAELLPGDQIRLERYEGETPLQPKGFLRFDRMEPGDATGALTAVVFGRAERVKIERFGDSGYDFRPPWWAGIAQNLWLVGVSTLIAGLLGLLGGYAAVREIHARSPQQAWKAYLNPCPERGESAPQGEGGGHE
jgi:hypothetical protein